MPVGLKFEVQAADTLLGTNWQTISYGVTVDGENFEFTDPIAKPGEPLLPQRFYRLIQVP